MGHPHEDIYQIKTEQRVSRIRAVAALRSGGRQRNILV